MTFYIRGANRIDAAVFTSVNFKIRLQEDKDITEGKNESEE